MRKSITPAQKAEAVSLATVIGAEGAAKQLGWDPRSIRKWTLAAGKAPADAISSTDWRSLGDLARSQVAAKLAAGKVTPVQAATIAGIADRNARDVTVPDAEPDADRVYVAALEEAFGEHADLALIAALYRLKELDYADVGSIPEDVNRDVWEWVAAIPDLPAWREADIAKQGLERQAQYAEHAARSASAWATTWAAGSPRRNGKVEVAATNPSRHQVQRRRDH